MRDTVRLLRSTDPAPVIVHNAGAASPFLIVCDHAGRATPEMLGDLGVAPKDWERHIAWDIGAAGVARLLGQALQAVTIEQVYSRLVIDCNRRPGHPTSIAPISDGTVVPANAGLSEGDAASRVNEIFAPYHDRIAAELDRRQRSGQPAVRIAVHSFTPARQRPRLCHCHRSVAAQPRPARGRQRALPAVGPVRLQRPGPCRGPRPPLCRARNQAGPDRNRSRAGGVGGPAGRCASEGTV